MWWLLPMRRNASVHSLLSGSGCSVDLICWFIRCDHAAIHASWASSQSSCPAGGAEGAGEGSPSSRVCRAGVGACEAGVGSASCRACGFGGGVACRRAGRGVACRRAGRGVACRRAGGGVACRRAGGGVVFCRAGGGVASCRAGGAGTAGRPDGPSKSVTSVSSAEGRERPRPRTNISSPPRTTSPNSPTISQRTPHPGDPLPHNATSGNPRGPGKPGQRGPRT